MRKIIDKGLGLARKRATKLAAGGGLGALAIYYLSQAGDWSLDAFAGIIKGNPGIFWGLAILLALAGLGFGIRALARRKSK